MEILKEKANNEMARILHLFVKIKNEGGDYEIVMFSLEIDDVSSSLVFKEIKNSKIII